MNLELYLSKTISMAGANLRGGRYGGAARDAGRKIKTACHNFYNDGRGTTALEYALIAAITAMVAIVGIVSVGGNASASLHLLDTTMAPAAAPAHGNNGAPDASPSPQASPGPGCTGNCSSTTTVP